MARSNSGGTGEIFGLGDTRFRIVNASSIVDWGNFPTIERAASFGFINTDQIGLGCYSFGAPASPNNNTLWYEAYDVARGTHGWIDDDYLSTPGTASSPQLRTDPCDLRPGLLEDGAAKLNPLAARGSPE